MLCVIQKSKLIKRLVPYSNLGDLRSVCFNFFQVAVTPAGKLPGPAYGGSGSDVESGTGQVGCYGCVIRKNQNDVLSFPWLVGWRIRWNNLVQPYCKCKNKLKFIFYYLNSLLKHDLKILVIKQSAQSHCENISL